MPQAEYEVIVPTYKYGAPLRIETIRDLPTDSAWHHIENSIGYTKSANMGLAMCAAPFVVLFNSDSVVLTRDGSWLEKLAEPMKRDSRLGMVGPRCANPRQGLAGTIAPNQGFVYVHPEMSPHGIIDVKIHFWCIMLRREAIEDVGYLDERFSPGGGDDDDWMIRAYQKGWKAGIQTDVCVDHIGQASWPALESLEARSERAHCLLLEKYPPDTVATLQ